MNKEGRVKYWLLFTASQSCPDYVMSALKPYKLVTRLLLIAFFSTWLVACETIGYYEQAARGQLSILWNRQPIEDLLVDQTLPQSIRNKLVTVLSVREFAERELGLPAEEHYQTFVDLKREHVVWNVFAAPEFSVEPLNWCYPVAGCVSYRGYFSEARALKYASKLQAEGFDVYTGGVDAYSTLGWFKDPLPSSVLNRADYQLAALVFHELAHQLIYLPGDTTFNESFATTVEQEGLRRWLEHENDSQSLARAEQQSRRRLDFVRLVSRYRDQFDQLYQGEGSEQNLRIKKQALQEELRSSYEALKQDWGGVGAYDGWFAGPLNNAQLSTVASYNDLVPAFQALLDQVGGDLHVFYTRVQELSELDATERQMQLDNLATL